MPDSIIKYTPNLNLALLPANYRIWAQIINDNLTTVDAAINGFVQFSNLRGTWSNSTHYAVGDTVVDGTTAVLWTALIDHTSAQIPTTFAEDSLAHPGTWILAAAPATQRGVWSGPGTAYNVGDFVLADGMKFAMCIVQHVSSASFDADVALGYWTVLVDLSIAGSQVLPILSGAADALKFVNTDPAGTAYEIVTGTTAMQRLEGVLPVVKGGTGVGTSTGVPGSVVLSQSPFITTPTIDGSLTYGGVVVAPSVVGTGSMVLSSAVPITLPPNGAAGGDLVGSYPNPFIRPSVTNGHVLTTVAGAATWAAASGGASISVGTTPPASPVVGALWWNSDASAGGGQMFIYYNDGSTTQWVPASPSMTLPPAGTLGFYSEQVLSSLSTSITAAIPTSFKLLQIEFDFVTTVADVGVRLIGMRGGSPDTTANYNTFIIQTTTPTQMITAMDGNASGGWQIGGANQGWGRGTWGRDQRHGHLTGTYITSAQRWTFTNELDTGIATPFDGLRLTCASGNFTADSFLRCYVVT